MKPHRARLSAGICCLLALFVLAGAVYAFWAAVQPSGTAQLPAASAAQPASQSEGQSAPTAPPAAQSQVAAPAAPATALQTDEWRAVWLSYLEYQQMDLSNEAAAEQALSAVFDQMVQAGFNTVVAQVRPFGDALYPSEIFPWSHLLTGTQGQNPGYDPLALMVRLAHARGLRLEVWVNPYRVKGTSAPAALAENNPAAVYLAGETTAGWVHQTETGLWYDPGVPEVRQLIVDGVAELCSKYQLDGIQFDDYFYPTTDESFDADTYAAFGQGAALADWRRANVDTLIRAVHDTTAAAGVPFGVSPQGNNDNNYNQQYSDVALWAQSGWVDYLCPQLYWGFDYRTASGSDAFAFNQCLAGWLAIDRADTVALYVGLGAWRIGEGDGSAQPSEEWQSGNNLSRMVTTLRAAGAGGYAIYRYGSLWNDAVPLCAAELQALTLANTAG